MKKVKRTPTDLEKMKTLLSELKQDFKENLDEYDFTEITVFNDNNIAEFYFDKEGNYQGLTKAYTKNSL